MKDEDNRARAEAYQKERKSTMDISIDIETLSTRSDAAIVSIGAAEFERATGVFGRTFYVEVELNSAIQHGHVDGDTIAWWFRQEPAAKGMFCAGRTEKKSLPEALAMFSQFVLGSTTPVVWGNGATFDITILESAYRSAGHVVPWQFRDVRDMRTLVDAASAIGFERSSIPFVGVVHNAAADAEHQARVIAACWHAITCSERHSAAVSTNDRAVEAV